MTVCYRTEGLGIQVLIVYYLYSLLLLYLLFVVVLLVMLFVNVPLQEV